MWLCSEEAKRINTSHIWRGFMDVVPFIRLSIKWQIESGQLFRVGIDRFVGDNICGDLSEELINVFHARGYSLLHHICTHSVDRKFYWLGSNYFRLEGSLKDEWFGYVMELNRSGVSLRHAKDKLVWSTNSVDGSVTKKFAYDYLFNLFGDHSGKWWARDIWKWNILVKLVCFFWLVLNNMILTWDNLVRRGLQGLGMCYLCHSEEETINHLLFHCRFALNVWQHVCATLRLDWQEQTDTVEGHVQHWIQKHTQHRGLIIFICWGLWRCWNAKVFDDIAPNFYLTCIGIMGLFKDFKKRNHRDVLKRRVVEPLQDFTYPVGFFDGVAQGHQGGVGCRILIS